MEQPLSELDFGPGPERDGISRRRDFRDGERTRELLRADALDKGKEESAGGLLGEPSDPEDAKLLDQEREVAGCRRKGSGLVVKGEEWPRRGVRIMAARACGRL